MKFQADHFAECAKRSADAMRAAAFALESARSPSDMSEAARLFRLWWFQHVEYERAASAVRGAAVSLLQGGVN